MDTNHIYARMGGNITASTLFFSFILHSLILHFSLLTFHFSLSIPPLGG